MDALTLIPQLFYDLIGRITPGATLLISSFMLLQGPNEAIRHLTTWSSQTTESGGPIYKDLPTGLILLGNLLVSYVLGSLLASVWFRLSAKVLDQKNRERIQEAFECMSKTKLEQIDFNKIGNVDKVALVYDYIQLLYPKAGARLAKLRAEQLMGGSLSIGAILLSLLYGFYYHDKHCEWAWGGTELVLILVALAGFALARYLDERCSNAMINYWFLGSCGILEGQHSENKDKGKAT